MGFLPARLKTLPFGRCRPAFQYCLPNAHGQLMIRCLTRADDARYGRLSVLIQKKAGAVDRGIHRSKLDIISRPTSEKIFLEGPPGCGKTSAAAARLQQLLLSWYSRQEILVVTPQRTLAQPYMMCFAVTRPSGRRAGDRRHDWRFGAAGCAVVLAACCSLRRFFAP